jgi:DNA polymerase III delta' subunit
MSLLAVHGHGPVVRLLQRLHQRDRLPAALLLEGPPGCGRRTLARAWARALLCASPIEGDACGQCMHCQLVPTGAHPDLVGTAHDTAATPPTAEQIRTEVVEAAYQSPLQANRRVFIIHTVERLRLEAANALLKVLEEPPTRTRFVLTTALAPAVLRTIRSRCQLLRLGALGVDDLAQVLMDGGVPRALALARAAGGHGTHRDLWDDAPPVPLAALHQLATQGFRSAAVAEAVSNLPEDGDGGTVAQAQRAAVRRWLLALAQRLRQDLRAEDATVARMAAQRLERLATLHRDLALNLSPRLVLEALGLMETERLLNR